MISRSSWGLRGWRWSSLLVLAAAAGCSSQQSSEQRIKIALETAGMKATALNPLAGTVTIDGLPPTFPDDRKKHLVIALYDPQKPDAKHLHVLVREDGSFKFTEDGIAPGHYVLAFAVLRRKGPGNFIGPDALNNLYNDPDLNAKTYPQFVIDHASPGKKDYEFNLEFAGREPVTTPGPHAVTKVKP
ncbi:MAG TPA: hypothetical protein VFG04_12755 [Planctomycetaceae bacterium]|jgi:hypothetical protein|nr:hypothetical protein [Planctomycetaceae bacterium]